jgi:Ca2+-binding EF-hand superfamily protein
MMAASTKHSFTKEQVADFKENFAEVDADGSGRIDAKELKAVMEKCGVEASDAQMAELIKEVAGGKAELDFDDFCALMWKMQSGPTEKEIRNEMFAVST